MELQIQLLKLVRSLGAEVPHLINSTITLLAHTHTLTVSQSVSKTSQSISKYPKLYKILSFAQIPFPCILKVCVIALVDWLANKDLTSLTDRGPSQVSQLPPFNELKHAEAHTTTVYAVNRVGCKHDAQNIRSAMVLLYTGMRHNIDERRRI